MEPFWLWLGIIFMFIGAILMIACSIDKREGKEINSRKLGWSLGLLFVGATLVDAYTFSGSGPPERDPQIFDNIKSVLFIPPLPGGIFID